MRLAPSLKSHMIQNRMDDDEIEFLGVYTECTVSPPKKRQRTESAPQQEIPETPNSDDIVTKAAQLKRRLTFCEKEKEELSKRFQEIKDQLTKEQCCQLDVKLEESNGREPLICVNDSGDEEVIFVPPEDYSPLKKRKLKNAQKAEKCDDQDNHEKKEIAITYFKPGTNLPHARENCAAFKFVQSNVTTSTVSCNEIHCEQCYCYICDAPVKKCDSWRSGNNPHCNGYAKNAFWEKLRKMAKRKTIAQEDSLLKCLPENEQTEALRVAASKTVELLEALKDEINRANSSRCSSPACCCDCHGDEYDSDNSYGYGEGCRWCWEEHEGCVRDWSFGGFGRGWDSSNLSQHVSTTVLKATEYLKSEQPSQAAVVLDGLTVLLLSADGERFPVGQVNAAMQSLQKAWVGLFMHPALPKNVEDKVKERLRNAVNGALICSPNSTGLKVALEMKKWDNQALMQCFEGKLADGFITEDEVIVRARLAYLEKNKSQLPALNENLVCAGCTVPLPDSIGQLKPLRGFSQLKPNSMSPFQDALFYMLGCKVIQRNAGSHYMFLQSEQQQRRLVGIASYRHKFVLLLAKAGKIDQVMNVISIPRSVELDQGVLTNTKPKEPGINISYSQCALGSMSYADITEVLTSIVREDTCNSAEGEKIPLPQSIPEEKFKKVLVLILSGVQINCNLRTETALEWCVNTFCESSLSNSLTKDVRQKFVNEAEKLLDKAKNKLLSPSDINPPRKSQFKVFVVELFAALAVRINLINNQTYQITNSLAVFKRKGLVWACVSIVLSSAISKKIGPHIVGFVLENVIKSLGSDCFPSHVYESWINKMPDIYGIEKIFEIAEFILQEEKGAPGKNKSNSKGMVLMRKVIERIKKMLQNGSNFNKEKLTILFKKLEKVVPPELKELKDLGIEMVGLTFKNDPTYSNLLAAEVACKQENWPQLRESLLRFIKKHCRSLTVGCIDVFGQCLMFDEVKHILDTCGQTGSLPGICLKIKQTLSKLSQDNACLLAASCANWLGQALCHSVFLEWRYGYRSTPREVISCVRAIGNINVQTMNEILSTAMCEVTEVFLMKTVHARNRSDLERWLKDIKELFFSQNQIEAWSWAFHEITTGRLKRKPAVVSQLKTSSCLLTKTIPHYQLEKMQVKKNAADSKPVNTTTASSQSANKSASVSTNVSRSNSPRATATTHKGVNMALSTMTRTSNSAVGKSVQRASMNLSTLTSTAVSKPFQGTVSSKPGVKVAMSSLSNNTVIKPVQVAVMSKSGVNVGSPTLSNSGFGKPVQAAAASKQGVSVVSSTLSSNFIGKPVQHTVASSISVNMTTSTQLCPSGGKQVQSPLPSKQSEGMTTNTPTVTPDSKTVQAATASISVKKASPTQSKSLCGKQVSSPAASRQNNVNTTTSTYSKPASNLTVNRATPVQSRSPSGKQVQSAEAQRQNCNASMSMQTKLSCSTSALNLSGNKSTSTQSSLSSGKQVQSAVKPQQNDNLRPTQTNAPCSKTTQATAVNLTMKKSTSTCSFIPSGKPVHNAINMQQAIHQTVGKPSNSIPGTKPTPVTAKKANTCLTVPTFSNTIPTQVTASIQQAINVVAATSIGRPVIQGNSHTVRVLPTNIPMPPMTGYYSAVPFVNNIAINQQTSQAIASSRNVPASYVFTGMPPGVNGIPAAGNCVISVPHVNTFQASHNTTESTRNFDPSAASKVAHSTS